MGNEFYLAYAKDSRVSKKRVVTENVCVCVFGGAGKRF